jgi:tetratricopeptide (TPR) repeat protein
LSIRLLAYAGSCRTSTPSDARSVAVEKCQLGVVRTKQRLFKEALQAFDEGRQLFMRLNEQAMVAMTWHQTGNVHFEMRQSEAAENAYLNSLRFAVRSGDVRSQANTLAQLGALYSEQLWRLEDAVGFYRQAIDKYTEAGDVATASRASSNLSNALRKLCRLDAAREESRLAIERGAPFGHSAKPWITWSTLSKIEHDAGDLAAAAKAKKEAVACFLEYRRDGGEDVHVAGRICHEVYKHLLNGDTDAASSQLERIVAELPELASIRVFIQVLQAIVAGSRDHFLDETPGLDYAMAAEILLLLEKLENHR